MFAVHAWVAGKQQYAIPNWFVGQVAGSRHGVEMPGYSHTWPTPPAQMPGADGFEGFVTQ